MIFQKSGLLFFSSKCAMLGRVNIVGHDRTHSDGIIWKNWQWTTNIQTNEFHFLYINFRLEQSDFFSQWIGEKMKIQLEKLSVNISKLTGGKNEKPRRGALHEKLRLDLYFVYKKHWMEIKISKYVICRQEAFQLKFYYIYIMYSRQKWSLVFYSFLLLTNYENV